MKELLENKLFKMCMILILIVIIVIVVLVAIVSNRSKSITEYGLINAAKRYYENNKGALPKENYEYATVSVSTLVANGYISENANGATCPSYATVINMNGGYEYSATILCNNGVQYTTLLNRIKLNTVTSGSGLYNINNKYVYRGENPNNYIKFANTLWRIIGIDENNNIKIIYDDVNTQYQSWDDRYNNEIQDQRGINDYIGNEKSRIKDYLDNIFTNQYFSNNLTYDRISMLARHSICVGKINTSGNDLNPCSKVLDNELVTTLSADDYVTASLDPSCSITNSVNCQNYNFLNYDAWTSNASSANTYEVYYIDPHKGLVANYASLGSAILPVLALKNSTVYVSGSGTELDPYIIK